MVSTLKLTQQILDRASLPLAGEDLVYLSHTRFDVADDSVVTIASRFHLDEIEVCEELLHESGFVVVYPKN